MTGTAAGLRRWGRQVSVQIIAAGLPSGIIVNPLSATVQPPGVPVLRVVGEVSKSLDGTAQKARVEIRNLAPWARDAAAGVSRRVVDMAGVGTLAERNRILAAGGTLDPVVVATQSGFATLRVVAGYAGETAVLFEGIAETARNRRDGVDWVTEIETTDGSIAIQRVWGGATYPPGTTGAAFIADQAARMGVALGSILAPSLAGYVFRRGYTSLALARDEIDALCRGVGAQWWIEDGTLHVVDRLQPLPLPPVVVSTLPVPGAVQALDLPIQVEGGGIEVRTLLAPDLAIGRAVTLISESGTGLFRVDSRADRFDNEGGSWESVSRLRNLDPLA